MSDIVKTNNALINPEFNKPLGFENLDDDIVIVPRVKIMQATSPELQDEDNDFRMGDIIHSLLLEKLPEKFIPISIFGTRTMFVPRNDKKEFFEAIGLSETDTMFVCRSLDGSNPEKDVFNCVNCKNCIFNKFGWNGKEDTPPLCTHTINVLALFDGQEMPVVIPFANTNFTNGRKFVSMAKYSGGACFTKKYKICTKKVQNDKGIYYVTPVKPAGKPTKEELMLASQLYQQFSGVTIEVEQDTSVENTQQSFDF